MRYNEAELRTGKSSVFRNCRNFSEVSPITHFRSLCPVVMPVPLLRAVPDQVKCDKIAELLPPWTLSNKKSSSVGKWGVGWSVCETLVQFWTVRVTLTIGVFKSSGNSLWSSCGPTHWTRRKKGNMSDKIFCVGILLSVSDYYSVKKN